jgi:broad specificity phosphatase PhoE
VGVILLVRHGQASFGAADYDVLSETGEMQSTLLGAALADRVTPTRLLRGRMRRHKQTALAASAAAGWAGPSFADRGWDEFDHVQMLAVHTGPDSEEAPRERAAFQRWFDEATARWVSGEFDQDYDEPFGAFTARVDDALRRTADGLGSGDTAVVFTSGGPVSWVAASLLGGGTDLWGRLNPVMVNTGVTKVVVGRRGPTLVSINDHSHLEPGHVTYR